ncbi:MAG: endosialidase [Eubacteriales bacterium]|nr:endosialidase [Eubacteriales bacterium]
MSKVIGVSGGKLAFGDYKVTEKQKEQMEFEGDLYKIKSHNQVTRLSRNNVMVFESVPGTRVENFVTAEERIEFDVYGDADASIILAVEDKTNFMLDIDGIVYDNTSYIAPGKLNINVTFEGDGPVHVLVQKNPEA